MRRLLAALPFLGVLTTVAFGSEPGNLVVNSDLEQGQAGGNRHDPFSSYKYVGY